MEIMRRLAISLLFLLLGSSAFSQLDCQIFPNDTTVCYGSFLSLNVPLQDSVHYYWHNTGDTTAYTDVIVWDTTKYYVTIYNQDSTESCTDSVTISIYPKIIVTFDQINIGCPSECKSQVIAKASGGYPPYRYVWGSDASVAPNDSSLALGLCSNNLYNIQIYNTVYNDTICKFDTSYLVDAYKLPLIDIMVSPDSIFTTNPVGTLSFDNTSIDSIQLTNWIWIFSDGTSTNEQSPKHLFTPKNLQDTAWVDTVIFKYTTMDGCIDSITDTIQIKKPKLSIPNVFTPNGDGINDTWEIADLDRYINNDLYVFNRWGEKVFSMSDYQGHWNGSKLPDGMYYYILHCYGYWKEEVYRGGVSIVGSRY